MEINTREDLAKLYAERGYTVGAEIGVADGRHSLMLLETIPGLQLMCVDPWSQSKGNQRGGSAERHKDNYELAKERLLPYGATLDRRVSMDAVDDYEKRSLDFIHIDGNHDFDFVMMDLIKWVPKVRTGGVVSGHDYYHFKRHPAGVIEAVDAYTAAHGITFQTTKEKEVTFWWTIE